MGATKYKGEKPVDKPVVEEQEVVEQAAPEPKIPLELLEKFVGASKIPGFFKIEQRKVRENKWRVNVFVKNFNKINVIPEIRLDKSYFLEYNTKTKRITDETNVLK